MAFNFSKKKPDDEPKGNGKSNGGPKVVRNPDKAAKFFEHARTVADSRQFDYAIELYMRGLKLDPDNLRVHEDLLEVAKRRKVDGGKPAGLKEKLFGGGGDEVDRMLHAEVLWAKDPLNVKMMVAMMERACEAAKSDHDLRTLYEVGFWVGMLIIEAPKKPGPNEMAVVRDKFAEMERWAEAVTAGKMALVQAPNDENLLKAQHDVEANHALHKGNYDKTNAADVNFRDSIRDKDKQIALDAENSGAKSASKLEMLVNRAREAYAATPDDLAAMQKLAELLLEGDDPDMENEAIELYDKAFETTSQYKYKERIGTIRMRQLNRQVRAMRSAAAANPKDAAARDAYDTLLRRQLDFELKEYTDRVEHYPTDVSYRFELGKRLHRHGNWDEAITAFQVAKTNPKYRVAAHGMLARCYVEKGWLNEAIDTLNAGLDLHPVRNDTLGMEMSYLLLDTLCRSAEHNRQTDPARALQQARDAQALVSQMLQVNINYKDIQQRMEETRKLVESLAAAAK